LFSSEHDLQIAWNSEANAKLSPLYSLISWIKTPKPLQIGNWDEVSKSLVLP
jgi:hypothetical protein